MIRPLEKNDLPACAKLLQEVYNSPPRNHHWTDKSAQKYLAEFFAHPRFVGFVYIDDSEILGAIFMHERTWWAKDELFVNELFVTPKLQGQGIGTKLVKTSEQYCKDNNLAGIALFTNRYFQGKTFYEKTGYYLGDHVAFYYKEL